MADACAVSHGTPPAGAWLPGARIFRQLTVNFHVRFSQIHRQFFARCRPFQNNRSHRSWGSGVQTKLHIDVSSKGPARRHNYLESETITGTDVFKC